MRSGLFVVGALICVTLAEDIIPQHNVSTPLVGLEEVYGLVQTPDTVKPWSDRVIMDPLTKGGLMAPFATPKLYKASTFGSGTPTTPQYKKTHSRKECKFPLNVMIVQDDTSSFEDDVENMRNNQLQEMFKVLDESHPGSRFNLVTFHDKPVYPLGVPDYDYCVEFPLNKFVDSLDEMIGAYAPLKPNGGGDYPENQFGAIIAALQDDRVSWEGREEGFVNLIVVSTDAMMHYEGDGSNTMGLAPYSGKYEQQNLVAQCEKQHYPSPYHVRDALADKSAYLVTLISDGWADNGLPWRTWEWFNGFLGQTSDFIGEMKTDSSDFWVKLDNALKAIEDIECPEDSTTTPLPPVPTTQFPAVPTTQVATTSVAEEDCTCCKTCRNTCAAIQTPEVPSRSRGLYNAMRRLVVAHED